MPIKALAPVYTRSEVQSTYRTVLFTFNLCSICCLLSKAKSTHDDSRYDIEWHWYWVIVAIRLDCNSFLKCPLISRIILGNGLKKIYIALLHIIVCTRSDSMSFPNSSLSDMITGTLCRASPVSLSNWSMKVNIAGRPLDSLLCVGSQRIEAAVKLSHSHFSSSVH